MRNALLFVIVGSGLSLTNVNVAPAADVPTSSVYAVPVTGQAEDGRSGLLSINDTDQQQSPLNNQAGRLPTPQASVVEAIPTPTAFQAGGVLLILILMVRAFRKLRWA